MKKFTILIFKQNKKFLGKYNLPKLTQKADNVACRILIK